MELSLFERSQTHPDYPSCLLHSRVAPEPLVHARPGAVVGGLCRLLRRSVPNGTDRLVVGGSHHESLGSGQLDAEDECSIDIAVSESSVSSLLPTLPASFILRSRKLSRQPGKDLFGQCLIFTDSLSCLTEPSLAGPTSLFEWPSASERLRRLLGLLGLPLLLSLLLLGPPPFHPVLHTCERADGGNNEQECQHGVGPAVAHGITHRDDCSAGRGTE